MSKTLYPREQWNHPHGDMFIINNGPMVDARLNMERSDDYEHEYRQ